MGHGGRGDDDVLSAGTSQGRTSWAAGWYGSERWQRTIDSFTWRWVVGPFAYLMTCGVASAMLFPMGFAEGVIIAAAVGPARAIYMQVRARRAS